MHALPASAEHQAYDYILRHIRSGRFGSGYRLIAEDIASAISASRMPVREAFRRLASEGLVEIQPNRGVTVRSVSISEMREVFEMRAVLEGQAARAALARIGPRELAQLESRYSLMNQHGQDAQAWVTYHRDFHELICQFSGRNRLIGQIASLHSVVEPHMRFGMPHPPHANDTADHRALLDAIHRRDPDEVEAAMRAHIVSTIAVLEDAMTGSPPSRPSAVASRS